MEYLSSDTLCSDYVPLTYLKEDILFLVWILFVSALVLA